MHIPLLVHRRLFLEICNHQSLSADTLLDRWEEGLKNKKHHLAAELVLAHVSSPEGKMQKGEQVLCIDWSKSWGSVYKLGSNKTAVGAVITNGLGVILWEGIVESESIKCASIIFCLKCSLLIFINNLHASMMAAWSMLARFAV